MSPCGPSAVLPTMATMMIYGEHGGIVETCLCIEAWGSSTTTTSSNATSWHHQCIARFGVFVMTISMIIFPILLLSEISSAEGAFLFSYSITFLNTTLVLLSIRMILQCRPLNSALKNLSFGMLFIRGSTAGEEDDEFEDAEDQQHPPPIPAGENSLLIVGDIQPHPWHSDKGIRIHAVVFLTSVILSSGCDILVGANNQRHAYSLRESYKVKLVVLDVVKNILFCSFFLWWGISTRILALRVWQLRDCLVDFQQQLQVEIDTWILQQVRQGYEDTFEAATEVSQRTSVLGFCIFVLAMMELIASLQSLLLFAAQDNVATITDPFLKYVGMLCPVLVLASLLLSAGFASANLMFASDALAELMAQMECHVRQDLAKDSIFEEGALSGRPSVAELLRAMGYRIKNFPVRISLGGHFYMSSKWYTALALLIVFAVIVLVGSNIIPQSQ